MVTVEDGAATAADALGEAALFAGLRGRARVQLAKSAVARRVAAGTQLFRQDDSGESLFVVVSGRIDLVVEEPPPERVMRVVGPGGVFGELALLTGGRRSASAWARRDSELLEIDRGRFVTLLQSDADVAMATLRLLGSKLADTDSAPARTPPATTTIAVFAHDPGLADLLGDALRRALASWGRVAVLRDDAGRDERAHGRALDLHERANDVVVLIGGDLRGDIWEAFCRRQADRVVVAVHGTAASSDELPAGCDLVLVGPGPAARYLDGAEPRSHHRIREPADQEGVARVARRLTGRSIGLVLSGGGARGLAHVGVLEALAADGVNVDRVGGCSMGALIAAHTAVGTPPHDIEAWCRRELVDRKAFNDFTMPRVALLRGRKARDMLRRAFGDVRIEDTDRDLFCVSADLVSAEVVVHRRGLVRDAVGASMAMPGLVPPVVDDGRVLVDGGVLDNMPVDVMDDAGEGPVIAVDVMSRGRLAADRGRRPNVIDTLARATVLGSWRWTAQARERAALLIEPDVASMGLLDFGRLGEAIEAGRRAAHQAIALRPELTGSA